MLKRTSLCVNNMAVFFVLFQYIAVGRSNKLDELVYMLDEWASTKKFNDIHRYHECISTASRNVKNLLPTPKSGANLMPKLNEDRGAVRKSTFGM